jgi:hypothetical protein
MLGPRTVKIRFPKFDNYTWFQGGHLFRVASSYRGPGCSKRCFDVAPNRGWVINDFTAPRIPRFDLPTVATFEGQARARLKYRVTDLGFSGLDKHRIWIRKSGSDAWRNVATRTGGGPRSYTLELEEGQSASVRMSVRDRGGNGTVSPTRTVTAPIDDGSAAVGTFFGLWEQRATEGAYRGTEHVSVSPFDELRSEATGTRYCLLFAVGPDYGTAEVSVGDFSYQINMYSDTAEGLHKTCAGFLEPEVRAVVVRPLEGRINVDGVLVDGMQTSGPPSRNAARPPTTLAPPDGAMGREDLRRYAGALPSP